MWIVIAKLEILKAEFEEASYLWIKLHDRLGAGLAAQLQPRLIEMIQVQVNIAEAVNETAGFVLPRGDIQGIGQAILKLSKDPILRDRLGKLGQTRVRRLFSIDRTIDEYFRLYRECMASVHG